MKRTIRFLALLLVFWGLNNHLLADSINPLPCQAPPVADFVAFETSGCGPLEIRFFDQSQGAVTSWNWTFPGGDTLTSNEQNPTVLYDTIGIYPVSLTVSNTDGSDQITKNGYVEITGHEVIIDFSFEKNGRTISFQNNSQWSDDFSWDFGDGQFSTKRQPVHTYATDGTYIVRLKGTNACDGEEKTEIVILGCCGPPVAYNANQQVPTYSGSFRPGANLGYNPPWSDEQLADIAAGNEALGVPGAGCKTIRPALHESFLEEWGYDIRFDTYKHYASLGLDDLTAIVGFPSPEHRDPTFYCEDHQSELFANMYTPIWDNGENGTPINDTNYLALYLFKTLHLYKDKITFWEIWNEPGFDYTFTTGWLGPGQDGNWFENDPDPCDYKLRAPIYHYIRTLRISYEVIKTIDPDAYVTLASVGFTSFLDAILRNTDNPIDGSVDADHPLTGGAYFDAIAIHSYPHFDGTLRKWDQQSQSFIYERHTDKAAKGIELTQDTFQVILDQYGYDGITHPKKEWIITEINVPRKSFLDYIGSDTVQINYILKAYVESVINDIRQIHIYDMAESFEFEDAVNEFQLMGIYKRLFGVWPYNERINDLGIAYKTASDLLYNSDYDPHRSADMQLPPGLRGEAFLDHNGHYTYVLWVATTEDLNEEMNAAYSFPTAWNIPQLQRYQWDHSYFPGETNIGAENIALTARPIFLKDTNNTFLTTPLADFTIDTAVGCLPMTVQFQDASTTNVTQWEWTFEGGSPGSSTLRNPSVTYGQSGIYDVRLKVSNTAGSHEISMEQLVEVDENLPVSDFQINIFDKVVTCSNNSSNATHYEWDMGTGEIRYESNPTITYPIPGLFTIKLIAFNGCGSDTSAQTFIIDPDQLTPVPNFTSDVTTGCAPLEVQFTDLSTDNTTDWWWFFEGGTPEISTAQNPVITFENPGTYFVRLIATNASDLSAESFKGEYITVDAYTPPVSGFDFFVSGANVNFNNISTGANTYLWQFGDGSFSNEADPTHYYTDGNYTVTLISYNSCGTDTSRQNITIVTPPTADFSADTQSGCTPLSVQFQDESSDNSTAWEWHFPGGDPESSFEQNPLVNYTTPGNYFVTLIVRNSAGESQASRSNWISVSGAPEALFTWQLNGKTISFDNASVQADSLRWSFGDGNSSSAIDPTHNYANNDTYTVKLEVFNDCGRDTYQEEITIDDQAIAGFDADRNKGCVPFSIQFNDQSSTNTISWEWEFPGGNPATSSDPNPSVTYNQSGLYNVRLTVRTATDSSTFDQVNYILAEAQPTANFDAAIDVLEVRFDNQSNKADRYLWRFGDGQTSTDQDPVHQYAIADNYNVSLTAYNDCDSSVHQMPIALTGIPTAAFTADLREGCSPLSVQFTDQSSDNSSERQWSFPGGQPASSQEQNPVVVYTDPGVYNVSLEVSNSAGSNRNEQMGLIRVIGFPQAAFEAQFQGDSTFAFINQSTDADHFTWFFADGNSSQLVDPVHDFPRSGSFFVQLIAVNDCGSDTLTQEVIVPESNVLEAALQVAEAEGCAPLTVRFTDRSTGQPNNWAWQFPGGQPASSNLQEPVVTYAEAGQYDVQLIVAKDADSDTLKLQGHITVGEAPQAAFEVSQQIDATVQLNNNSLLANDFLWLFGDGDSSRLANPMHTYRSSGQYNIQLIASNECGRDTMEQAVNIQLTSLDPLEKTPFEVLLFPNPNSGRFQVLVRGTTNGPVHFRLYNSIGQLLRKETSLLSNGLLQYNWDSSGLESGAYWLEVRAGDQQRSKRLIIQR